MEIQGTMLAFLVLTAAVSSLPQRTTNDSVDCRKFGNIHNPKITAHHLHDDFGQVSQDWAFCKNQMENENTQNEKHDEHHIAKRRITEVSENSFGIRNCDDLTKNGQNGFFFSHGTEKDYYPNIKPGSQVFEFENRDH